MNYKTFLAHLENEPKSEQLKKLRQYLCEIGDVNLRREVESFFINFSGKSDDRPRVVLVLLHGIRTRAEWQDKLINVMQTESDIEIVPTKYGVVSSLTLLVPWLRKKPASLIRRHFRDVRKQYPNHKIAIVAHSFGSYLVVKELGEHSEYIDRVLLCGSVLPHDFDWGQAWDGAKKSNVVNEVGAKDYWPVIAHISAPGCGASGYLGFGNPCVTDREHLLSHSGFFDNSHMRDFWVPFLVEGRIVPSKPSAEAGGLRSVLNFLCALPNAVVLYLIICIIGLLALFY